MTTSAQAFARAVAALVDEHDVTDVLAHFLVDGQRAVGAAAVGLLVRSRSGDLEVLTASSHRVSELEAYQAQQVDGPCAESVRTGAPVFESGADRLAARWPPLASLLTAAQCQAVQAHPMRWHGQVLGAGPDRLARLDRPGKRIEQAEPSAFEGGDLAAIDAARQELALDCLKPRFGGRGFACVKLLKPLAPPGEAYRPKQRLDRGAHHVTHRCVDREQRPQGRTVPCRRIGESDLLVGTDPGLSDR